LERFERSAKMISDPKVMNAFDRITVNPNVMQGKPCVRGMRVTVSLVVNLVASGMSTEEIIRSYPYLEPEDIAQCLTYAAWVVDERVIPLDEQTHSTVMGRASSRHG
jgi:uncharacterized protein (DUF433 family)